MVSRSIEGSAPGLPLPTRPGHMALCSLGKLFVCGELIRFWSRLSLTLVAWIEQSFFLGGCFMGPERGTLKIVKTSAQSGTPVAEGICLTCGLCCNGAIFSDVKLVSGDVAASLKSLGLPLIKSGARKRCAGSSDEPAWRFPQPCAALHGCRCRIYADRPGHCRAFECFLLKKFRKDRVSLGEALRNIRAARRRMDKVRKLLESLGETDGAVALGDRFRRLTKSLEGAQLDPKRAELYSRLTLAFHDLNILINENFYRLSGPS